MLSPFFSTIIQYGHRNSPNITSDRFLTSTLLLKTSPTLRLFNDEESRLTLRQIGISRQSDLQDESLAMFKNGWHPYTVQETLLETPNKTVSIYVHICSMHLFSPTLPSISVKHAFTLSHILIITDIILVYLLTRLPVYGSFLPIYYLSSNNHPKTVSVGHSSADGVVSLAKVVH